MTSSNGKNGHANGARAVAAGVPSELEICGAMVSAQTSLLEDARGLEAGAAAARSAAEQAVADARDAADAARAAFAADRTNDVLADAAARAQLRLDHARDDLARVVAEHDEAKAGVARAEKAIADAAGAHELAMVLEALRSPRRRERFEDILRLVVPNILALRECIRDVQAIIESDAELLARARELGGGAGLRESDYTPAGGVLAGMILEAGGMLPVSFHIHELRWLFEKPVAHRSWDRAGGERARKLVDLVLKFLEAKEQLEAQGHHAKVDLGRAQLARLGEVWGRHRDRFAAAAELESLERVERDAEVAAIERGRTKEMAKRQAHADRVRKEPTHGERCASCGGELFVKDPVIRFVADGRKGLRHPECQPKQTPTVEEWSTTAGDDFDTPRVG